MSWFNRDFDNGHGHAFTHRPRGRLKRSRQRGAHLFLRAKQRGIQADTVIETAMINIPNSLASSDDWRLRPSGMLSLRLVCQDTEFVVRPAGRFLEDP